MLPYKDQSEEKREYLQLLENDREKALMFNNINRTLSAIKIFLKPALQQSHSGVDLSIGLGEANKRAEAIVQSAVTDEPKSREEDELERQESPESVTQLLLALFELAEYIQVFSLVSDDNPLQPNMYKASEDFRRIYFRLLDEFEDHTSMPAHLFVLRHVAMDKDRDAYNNGELMTDIDLAKHLEFLYTEASISNHRYHGL